MIGTDFTVPFLFFFYSPRPKVSLLHIVALRLWYTYYMWYPCTRPLRTGSIPCIGGILLLSSDGRRNERKEKVYQIKVVAFKDAHYVQEVYQVYMVYL